ncbi:MAG TPA: hypothetical protein PLI09_17325 [Candidatus Hydrogenedentes bacterium]|nr:hypothetical protein [Candidatus Hydrogenedentota bacterium]
MEKDMHFFAVYALARSTGFTPQNAAIVATASQFVDDAEEDKCTILGNGTAIPPMMTAHAVMDYRNISPDEQWNVWVPFHFLPGNIGPKNNFEQRMICQKDSALAQAVMNNALNFSGPSSLHLLGIAAHVYFDTFAHQGFAGFNSELNKVFNESIKPKPQSASIKAYLREKMENIRATIVGTFAEILPVGHGAVEHLPDRPYLKWEYKRKKGESPVIRDNPEDFTLACEKLHGYFCSYLANHPTLPKTKSAKSWNDIKKFVRKLVAFEGKQEDRIDQWLGAIRSGNLFVTDNADVDVWYSAETWKRASTKEILSKNNWNIGNSDGSLYVQAALNHRDYVLRDLLPSLNLLAF